MLKWKLTAVFVFLFVVVLSAQPFREEIDAFRKEDSLHFPPRKANLFVGSSSLRLWPNLPAWFPGKMVINRGFGGSSLPDVIRYADEIILPYHPRQILIYCGENDLAAHDSVTARMVADRFQELFYLIRNRYRRVPIVFISIKPSPSRISILPRVREANLLIRQFLARQRRSYFVDVFTPMLTAAGAPREELFLEDRLHMNEQGYRIWQALLRPYIKK